MPEFYHPEYMYRVTDNVDFYVRHPNFVPRRESDNCPLRSSNSQDPSTITVKVHKIKFNPEVSFRKKIQPELPIIVIS